MHWITFSLIAGFFFTTSDLITRYILKGKRDAWAYSFWFSFFGSITSLPFFLANPKLPGINSLLILIVSGVLIVIQNLLRFKSTNILSPSISGAILKFRLIFVLVFGLIFLSETFNMYKLVGTTLTIVSGSLLLNAFKGKVYKKGIALAFFSTIFYATVITLYSIVLKSINAVTLTFFIFLIPAVLNLALMPNSSTRIRILIKKSPKPIILATVLAAFANLALNQALAYGEQSRVIILTEVFLIGMVGAEHIILKEQGNLKKKIIAVTLAVAGAIFIQLS